MTLKHDVVIDRFFEGKKSGKGAKMEVVEAGDNTTVLEGYGWAAYVINHNEEIYKCNGWIGFSGNTTHHMGMIGPLGDIDYFVYSRPTTMDVRFNRENFINPPNDKYERLNRYVLKPSDKFEFPEFNLVVRPNGESLVAETSDAKKGVILPEENGSDLVAASIKNKKFNHLPDYEKAAKIIINNDRNGLQFMKELAECNLDPRKHMHFDLNKLRESIHISEKIKEAISKYEGMINQKVEGKEFTPITLDGCMLFAKKEGGDIRVLVAYNTLDDIACFSGSVPEITLGKALYNKKIHKTMKDKIFKDKKQITPPEFSDKIAEHGLSDTANGLPDWISTKVIAHQLGVA